MASCAGLSLPWALFGRSTRTAPEEDQSLHGRPGVARMDEFDGRRSRLCPPAPISLVEPEACRRQNSHQEALRHDVQPTGPPHLAPPRTPTKSASSVSRGAGAEGINSSGGELQEGRGAGGKLALLEAGTSPISLDPARAEAKDCCRTPWSDREEENYLQLQVCQWLHTL